MSAYKCLIDGDVLVYESGFAAQKTRYYLDGDYFPDYEQVKSYCELQSIDLKEARKQGRLESELEVFPENVAINIARKKLSDILAEVGTSEFKFFLSGRTNFRDRMAVTKKYKGNRDDKPKPVHYDAVKEFYKSSNLTHPVLDISKDCEADDRISIEAYKNGGVVCSIDKDLNMIEGNHYNWGKQIKYKVSPSDALWFFMLQLLTGDSVDNITGIPRVGDKKARKLLDPFRNGDLGAAWQTVLEAYESSKGEGYASYLEEQGRLLWMQRKPEQMWTTEIMQEEIERVNA